MISIKELIEDCSSPPISRGEYREYKCGNITKKEFIDRDQARINYVFAKGLISEDRFIQLNSTRKIFYNTLK